MTKRTLLSLMAGLALALSACTSGDTGASTSVSPTTIADPVTTTTATTTMASTTMATITTESAESAESDVASLEIRAVEFSKEYYDAWPAIDAALERFADDVVFYDPADGDFVIEGSSAIVPTIRTFAAYYSSINPVMEEVFLSRDAAAYRASYDHGYWPPWSVEPADHPRLVGLDVVHFEGDSVTGFDIWFEGDSLETLELGCFAVDGCPEVGVIVERYVTAWASGDPDQIASLYDDDATFTDTLLGIEAVGPDEISGVAAIRFGPDDVVEVIEVYAQTNGPDVPVEDGSEVGRVIAVGIHYRVSSPGADAAGFESLTTFEIGARQDDGFAPHPEGLITREEVFHSPDSLATIMP